MPVLVILFLLNLILLSLVMRPGFSSSTNSNASNPQPPSDSTTEPAADGDSSSTTPQAAEAVSQFNSAQSIQKGIVILSMSDGENYHLFAYQPEYLPLTRLTDNNWDDIQPSVSPDGRQVAFSSRRNGYWDIYIWNLETNQTTRVTDTPAYDGAPCWSPDGQWLAYESYLNDNLEVVIQSIADLTQPAIQLTYNPGTDHSPSWSQEGRRIAFVSDQNGQEDIWVAYLDQSDNRFINVSNNQKYREQNPVWSPDGSLLAWSALENGQSSIFIWDSSQPSRAPRLIGPGSQPVWSADGESILSTLDLPNGSALVGYDLTTQTLLYPSLPMPGRLNGLDWSDGDFSNLISTLSLPETARQPAPALWQPVIQTDPSTASGRYAVVPLSDVTVPYPYLHDAVNESFDALRSFTGHQIGWDFLENLENAYLPITEPPTLPFEENWLYTGRAVSINSLTLGAGWMAMIREDYEGQTYWRIYLKARYQDGSQGTPLKMNPWNMNARYKGDPQAYEAGGELSSIPAGYWFDFTEAASRFGWERLPALINWRTYFPAARFNQFVHTGQISWKDAMQQLYPPEALATPTFIPTYTPTAVPAPVNSSFTPTPSPTATAVPTIQPTWTTVPQPGN